MKLASRMKAALLGQASDKLTHRAADLLQPAAPSDVPRAVAVAEATTPAGPRHSPAGSGWRPVPATLAGAILDEGVHRRRRLDYPEAADSFVAWLQAEGETGEISVPRLEALYAEHCEAEGLAMVPSNYLLQALARHAARWERRVPNRVGRRQRVTTYDIPRQPRATEAIPIKQWRAA
jgi:hypothetical protein